MTGGEESPDSTKSGEAAQAAIGNSWCLEAEKLKERDLKRQVERATETNNDLTQLCNGHEMKRGNPTRCNL